MKWLIHIKDDKIVGLLSLSKSKYTLGRGADCDLVLKTAKISRLHALLVEDADDYLVIDNNSTNHVFVNDSKVRKHRLQSGDRLGLADEALLLYLNEQDLKTQIAHLMNSMWEALSKEDFVLLKDVTDRMISLDEPETILRGVLKEVVKLVGAERGFIALVDAGGEIQKASSIIHNVTVRQDGDREALFSQSTVQQAIQRREPVFILRSEDDEAQDFSHSIVALNLLSVMCAPLLFGEKLIGVLYVDSGFQHFNFSDRDRFFFTILSDHAAIAIENAKLYGRVQDSLQQLSQNEARLSALLQLNMMTGAAERELAAFALEKSLELSKSEIGYVGFFDERNMSLRVMCRSKNPAQADSGDASDKFLLKDAGMWGKTIKKRQALIRNKASGKLNPLQEGYPDETIHIQRHMTLPVFEDKRIVAVLAVGNKEAEYVELDVRQLTVLAQAMWRLIQRKRAEKSLRESEEKHRIVLNAVPDPVAVYDLSGQISYLNPAFSRVFGWTLDEYFSTLTDFVPEGKLSEARLLREKITQGTSVSGLETSRLTKDGALLDVSVSGAGFFDNREELQGYVLTFQDISARKKNEEEIKFLAYHDVLTALPNRKAFYERLEENLKRERYQRSGERRTTGPLKKWALLFLDLDRFKYVNDTLGHDVGDELLKAVASRLRSCLRKNDQIFRLGGDEFTVLVNELPSSLDVVKVVDKILQEMVHPHHILEHELYVTVSIGISLYPDDGDKVEVLVKNADMAMYAAKDEGEAYHFFTEEMNRRGQERMQLENGLRQAILRNQFVLYYQPLVENEKGIVGMEALIRWQHPEWGMVSPDQFIPLAEETKAIILIGEWVLQTACQQLKTWHDAGYENLYMSVNVSTRQFREPNFVDLVERVVDSSGIDPDRLKLEITESSIMDSPEDAIQKMNALRAKGVHFSIDDFGTGYSSLSQLKHFPIDTLKIDRSFVMDAIKNHDDQEIIKAILSMAGNLRLETVAEGVETEEQKDFLSREGCQMMQGYYFSRPLGVRDFEEELKKHYPK